MHSFKDSAGRTWNVTINVSAIKRVLAALKVNLSELHEGEPALIFRLEGDATLLFSVVWELVKDQAKPLGVNQEQFDASLDAGTVGAAAEAFWGELADFFRSLRPRLGKLIEDVRNPRPAKGEPVAAESGQPSGGSPALSASTPAS